MSEDGDDIGDGSTRKRAHLSSCTAPVLFPAAVHGAEQPLLCGILGRRWRVACTTMACHGHISPSNGYTKVVLPPVPGMRFTHAPCVLACLQLSGLDLCVTVCVTVVCAAAIHEDDSDVVLMIKELLDTRIRSARAAPCALFCTQLCLLYMHGLHAAASAAHVYGLAVQPAVPFT